MYLSKTLSLAILISFLCSCSSLPKESQLEGNRMLSPITVASDIESYSETTVVWGGIIAELTNHAESSEIQIIAYPLMKDGRPDISTSPQGRFIAISNEYLEAHDYQKSRPITLSGTIREVRAGKIGEADYNFPILSIEKLVLWPAEGSSKKPDVRFNFGFGVSSGGRSSTSFGIGIGF